MDDSRLDRVCAKLDLLEEKMRGLEALMGEMEGRISQLDARTKKGPQFQALLSDTLKGSVGVSVDKSTGDTIRIRLL